MSKIDLEVIRPSLQNAEAIVRLSQQDLLHAGLSKNAARRVADPSNESHIERQLHRLSDYPERYMGGFAVGRLVAIGKTNEWLVGDQQPYEHDIREKVALLHDQFAGAIHLEERPIGIHSLVVDEEVDPAHTLEIVHSLADWALYRARGSEIRTGLYEGDPVEPGLRDKGFVDSGKRGKVLNVQNRLFIRPAGLRRQ